MSRVYRFGFNGQEKDDEWNGQTGSTYDFGARLYDARIGRWMACDRLAVKYPDLSPYNFVGNSPIVAIDPDGEKILIYYEIEEKDEHGLNKRVAYEYGSQMEVPDNIFVKKTIASLDEIGSATSISEKFDFLVETQDYNIEIYKGDYTEASIGLSETNGVITVKKYQTVHYNPSYTFKEISTGKYMLPFMNLWYELGHIYNAISDPESYLNRTAEENEYQKDDPDYMWDNPEEKFNTEENEQPLNEEKGGIIRHHHIDGLEVVKSKSPIEFIEK